MPSRGPKRSNKKRTTRPRRRAQEPRLTSSVMTTLKLKNLHNKEEIYPIPLSTLVSRSNIGADADIMGRSYSIRIRFAAGNNLNTVSVNLGHSGQWVRRGTTTDNFNQQFTDKDVSSKGNVTFSRRLQESEREVVNPDIGTNFINLRVRDSCGAIPGVTLRIYAIFHFTRRTVSTTFLGANERAVDAYADQDVSTGPIQPPTSAQDIPFRITSKDGSENWLTSGTVSPFTYRPSGRAGYNFVITLSGNVNKVGEFVIPDSAIQTGYTADGFEGTITTS